MNDDFAEIEQNPSGLCVTFPVTEYKSCFGNVFIDGIGDGLDLPA